MLTAETFRQQMRAFKDTGVYDEASIDFYLSVAYQFLPASRWGAQLDYGAGLFAAHHLVLDLRDTLSAAAGGAPGDVKGPATTKAIDKVSQGYDTKAVTFENQAFWNQTRYGVQLMQFAKQFGAGGIQLGPCSTNPNVIPFPFFGLPPF